MTNLFNLLMDKLIAIQKGIDLDFEVERLDAQKGVGKEAHAI